MSTTSGAPVELVTVPALGPEWKKSEMEAMTKRGRKKQKDSNRMENFRAWKRDQRGCCGKYGTRKQVAICLFITCVMFVNGFSLHMPFSLTQTLFQCWCRASVHHSPRSFLQLRFYQPVTERHWLA